MKDIIYDSANPSDSGYGYNMTVQDYYESISSLNGVSLYAKLIDIGLHTDPMALKIITTLAEPILIAEKQ